MEVTNEEKGLACALINAPWMHRNHFGIVFLRLAVGGMMLVHGYPKLLMLLAGDGPLWMDPLGIGGTASLALCCFAEFFCSLAIIFGLLTRLSSLVLAINFWVIVFMVDANATWAQSELPTLYLVCFLTLLCTGGGRYSIDHLIRRRLGCALCDAAPAERCRADVPAV